MRGLAVVLASSLIASGCAVNSYRIPSSELARLTQVAPEARGERVRVIEDISPSTLPPASPVAGETVVTPHVGFYVGLSSGVHHPHSVGGSRFDGLGKDSKAAAVAFILIAVTAMITAAVIEGSRFDGWARLHPMHPVHLLGHDGGYTVVPLAWLDPEAVAWTETAMVRTNEGPWLELDRAPLSREGLSYGLYFGAGSLRSADGQTATGTASTIQLGYFPTQELGIFGEVFFGWRNNRLGATMFESRYLAELQFMPLQLGILHAGGYAAAGLAYRFEDAVRTSSGDLVTGNQSSVAFGAGGMLQLDINTRVALTARLGVARAHAEQMPELLFGISVY